MRNLFADKRGLIIILALIAIFALFASGCNEAAESIAAPQTSETDSSETGSEESGDEDNSSLTTYQVEVNTSFAVYDLSTYYWNPVTEEIEDFVLHGDMQPGAITGREVTDHVVIDIALRLIPDGELYLVVSPGFYMSEGKNNVYDLHDEVTVYSSKSQRKTPADPDRTKKLAALSKLF